MVSNTWHYFGRETFFNRPKWFFVRQNKSWGFLASLLFWPNCWKIHLLTLIFISLWPNYRKKGKNIIFVVFLLKDLPSKVFGHYNFMDWINNFYDSFILKRKKIYGLIKTGLPSIVEVWRLVIAHYYSLFLRHWWAQPAGLKPASVGNERDVRERSGASMRDPLETFRVLARAASQMRDNWQA